MKCALITGASRGIGKAIALQLSADLKLHIIINYSSNKDAALETKSAIENKLCKYYSSNFTSELLISMFRN